MYIDSAFYLITLVLVVVVVVVVVADVAVLVFRGCVGL